MKEWMEKISSKANLQGGKYHGSEEGNKESSTKEESNQEEGNKEGSCKEASKSEEEVILRSFAKLKLS